MRNCSGVQTHLAHGFNCSPVILFIYCVGEQKLRLALQGVDLERQRHGWPNQNTLVTRLSNDKRALFKVKASPQRSRENDGAALAYFANVCHSHTSMPNARHSYTRI